MTSFFLHSLHFILFHSLLRGDFPSRRLQLQQWPLVSLPGVPDRVEESLLQNYEFWWVSLLQYLKNGWQNAVLLWCILQAGPQSLYYCAVVLHSCIALPPAGHSSNHQYHCCQLTRQSNCVSNFYRTFKVFIWLSLVDAWMRNDWVSGCVYIWYNTCRGRVFDRTADIALVE